MQKQIEELIGQNESLKARVSELEETLSAIRKGEVDAFIVETDDGEKVFSLTSAETTYRLLIEQMNEGAALIAIDGTVIYCNNRFAEIMNNPPEAIMGQKVDDFLASEHQSRLKSLYNKGVIESIQDEFSFSPDGEQKKHYLFSMAPFVKENDGTKGAFSRENMTASLIVTEISSLKEMERRLIHYQNNLEKKVQERTRELNEAKEKAEESDHLKSAFLANMSHEIRTPMNGILGFADLLKDPGLSGEEQKKYIQVIEKSGDRMLNIINDIIDISKIESGQMELNISMTNINKQLDYIYTFFKNEVEAKGLNFFIFFPLPSSDASIETDAEKLYAVLMNLVKNAIKFTLKGSIEFGYTFNKDYLLFFVKDTGIGIQKERLDAIFDRFVQADIFDKQAHQGAGLGLSISNAYVKMMGGRLWVDSKPGEGSVFYFTLPYRTP